METIYIALSIYFVISSAMAVVTYRRARNHPAAIVGYILDRKKYIKAMTAIISHTVLFGPISFAWYCLSNKKG